LIQAAATLNRVPTALSARALATVLLVAGVTPSALANSVGSAGASTTSATASCTSCRTKDSFESLRNLAKYFPARSAKANRGLAAVGGAARGARKGIIGKDNRRALTSEEEKQFAGAGVIECKNPDPNAPEGYGYLVGNGSLVGSQSVVQTVGHDFCVRDAKGNFTGVELDPVAHCKFMLYDARQNIIFESRFQKARVRTGFPKCTDLSEDSATLKLVDAVDENVASHFDYQGFEEPIEKTSVRISDLRSSEDGVPETMKNILSLDVVSVSVNVNPNPEAGKVDSKTDPNHKFRERQRRIHDSCRVFAATDTGNRGLANMLLHNCDGIRGDSGSGIYKRSSVTGRWVWFGGQSREIKDPTRLAQGEHSLNALAPLVGQALIDLREMIGNPTVANNNDQ
jgi:hypothetical protein